MTGSFFDLPFNNQLSPVYPSVLGGTQYVIARSQIFQIQLYLSVSALLHMVDLSARHIQNHQIGSGFIWHYYIKQAGTGIWEHIKFT